MKKKHLLIPIMAISLLVSCNKGGGDTPTVYHYVTFVTNGGSTIEQAKVEDNKTLTKPTDPTKEGFIFNTWCTDEALTNEYDFSHLVTEDFTLYAKWDTKYSITYHNVTDSEHSNPKQFTEKDEIILSEARKDYYNFKGWFTDSTFKNPITKIEKGTKGNLDIYAEFKAIEYTITYDYDGGAGVTTPNSYTIETPTITLPTPTTVKTGYGEFDGWYFDKAHTQPAGTGWSAGAQHGNKNLYAKYKNPITYTISYPNVTDAEHNDPKQYTIETPTITLSKASRANYNFIGWFTDEACSETKKITEIKKGSTGDLDIYAKFKAIEYEITYELNGGTNDPRNPADYTIESTVTLYPATHQTLVFGGWCLKQDLTDNPITGWNPGDKTGKVTLYAKWVSEYTITYKNVTSEETSGFTVKYTSKDLPLTLSTPTRTDWTFNGYYTDETFSETSKLTNNIIPVGTTGNLTLYAKMVYKITSLENCTWEEIKMISEKGGGRATFGKPGLQTKTIRLKHQTGNNYQTVRIIGYNHDKDINGNTIGITFEFVNLISNANGISIATIWDWEDGNSTKNRDFPNSNLRKAIDGEGEAELSWYEKRKSTHSDTFTTSVLDMLPDDLRTKGIMKTVVKPIAVSSSYEISSYNTQLFPLSYREMTEKPSDSYRDEGETYEFYQGSVEEKDIKRVHKQINGATIFTQNWNITDGKATNSYNYAGYNAGASSAEGGKTYLRSPSVLVSYLGAVADCDGTFSALGVSNYTASVAPAFCI